MNWWTDHYTLVQVARWIEENKQFSDASEAIDYFDRPWKWTPEYREWVECELLDALAVREEHDA